MLEVLDGSTVRILIRPLSHIVGIANETTIAEKIMDELKPAVESMGGEEAVHEMALAIVRLVGRSAEEVRTGRVMSSFKFE